MSDQSQKQHVEPVWFAVAATHPDPDTPRGRWKTAARLRRLRRKYTTAECVERDVDRIIERTER